MKKDEGGVAGLNLCGCGDPERNLKMVYKLLKAREMEGTSALDWDERRKTHKDLVNDVLMSDPEATYELVMQLLDGSSNFLEHGGSIHGAWLTESGREFLRQVEAGDPKVEFKIDPQTVSWVEQAELRLGIGAPEGGARVPKPKRI